MIEQALIAAVAVLAAHGYLVVFLWMFADQASVPIPSVPILIAAGAVAGAGDLNLVGVIAAAVAGCVLADLLWYCLGRFKGAQAVNLVCKLSLEPDSCVTTTRNAFGRFGPATIVVAKYIPGVQTLAPASAGLVEAPVLGFLFLDTIGSLVFVLPFLVGGYFFQAELLSMLDELSEISGGLAWLVLGVVAVYLVAKALQWGLFLRGHLQRRISADDVWHRMERGEPLTVIDLRQRLDFEALPIGIPGALRIPITEIPTRRKEIPDKHDIVLVCT